MLEASEATANTQYMPIVKSSNQTAQSLEAIANQLEESATLLRTYSQLLTKENVKSIEVSNERQRELGIQCIDGWVAAVRKAITQYREQKGQFRAKNNH